MILRMFFGCESTGTLAFAGAGNAQSFPVFGDGAAGYLDTLAFQFLGNRLIG
jgi:hypothetical protein